MRPWALLLAALALAALPAPAARAAEVVTLQLKWLHAFQFAGYYAAEAMGYYRDAGFDVRIKEAQPGQNVVDDVVSGRADFGVGTSALLLAREAGAPVVVLAVIFQHSPYVLLTRKADDLDGVQSLAAKRIMLEPLADELLAYMKREGVPPERVIRQEHTFRLQDLVDGRTDAMSACMTSQPYDLRQAGVAFQELSPRTAGIDFYGDNLFTSEKLLRAHPERVRAFREASLRGWEYAMAHPAAIAGLILREYAPQRLSAEALRFEADRMRELVQAGFVPVGYMHAGRWRHIADTYAEVGMLPRNAPLGGFIYDPVADDDAWLYRSLGGALLAIVLVGAIGLHISRINRRLRASLAEVLEGRDRLQALSTAIEQSPTSVMITAPDTRIEYVNPQFCAITGYSAEEAIGKTTAMMKSGRTDPAVYRDMWAHLNRGEPWRGEIVNRRKSGECYWEDLHIAPVKNAAGETVHFVALKLDIEARKRAEANLAASEAKFRAFVENANDIIFSHDRDGVITYVSPNWTELIGHASDEIVGRNLIDLLHPDDAPAGREFIERMLATGSKQGGLEYRMRHRNGTWHWYTANGAPLFDTDGRVSAMLGIARDVSENKEAETRIRHMALYDALTDLPNRTLLFDRLAQAVRNARRDQHRLALMYVDLDRFKPINDTWGHAVGDGVLQAVAQRMLACVRESDTVGRIGGDEFVVLLREVEGAAEAAQVGEKIRRALGTPIVVGDGTYTVSSSVGIALFPDHGDDEHELALNADRAMYRAKAGGRDSVEMYRAEMAGEAPADAEDRTG